MVGYSDVAVVIITLTPLRRGPSKASLAHLLTVHQEITLKVCPQPLHVLTVPNLRQPPSNVRKRGCGHSVKIPPGGQQAIPQKERGFYATTCV
jgi:hypothetical protein